MIGVRTDGRKELVALIDGYRKSHESWADLLRDCRHRGMRARILAVGDGALASGKRCARSSRRRRSSVVGSTSRRISLLRFRSRRILARCAAMKEIYNAEDADKARGAITAFERELRREVPEGRREDRRRCRHAAGVLPLPGGALGPSAHDEPHRIYFRDGAFEEQGHQGAGLAMAFTLIEAAEARWRAVDTPHLVALVRAGAVFEKGKLIERPVDSSTTQEAA